MESNSTAFLIKIKLRHSLGRPSRSDFVQFEFHGSFNMNSEEYIRLSETASIQSQPVALVSEKEYEYGADAFEIYMKENKGKIKPEMKEVAVQKNEKAR